MALLLMGCGPGELTGAVELDAGEARDAVVTTHLDRATVMTDLRAERPLDDAWSEPDAFDSVSPRDLPPVCVPTRSSCNEALECGAIPDGCPGGVFRCAECGGGETWCATIPSRWQPRVYSCVQRAQSEHPEWFDPTQFRGTSSWLVLQAQAGSYVAEVARCARGGDAHAVVDANAPANEVRVRGVADSVAENFIVRTYGTGRTAGRYTSACTPAGF